MEVMVTFLIQTTIEAKSEKDYNKKLNKMTEKLEDMGFSVNLEDESSDDDITGEDCEDCDE